MPAPSCPRCAYDLSGAVATWDEAGACPLTGTCPECGLGFRWFDIFTRDVWRLDGFVEHARGVRRFANWAWRTTWWTLWPWNFWKRVEMHHRVRPWAWLWWFLLLLWLPRVVTNVLPAAQIALQSVFGYPTSVGRQDPLDVPSFAYALLGFEYSPYATYYGPTYGVEILPYLYVTTPTAFALGACALWPLSMLALPISMRLARVRLILVVRAAVFSLGPIALLAITQFAMFAVSLAASKFLPAGFGYYPPGVRRPWAYVVISSLERINQLLDYAGWVMIPWIALWWLATLTRGFKLRHGALAWLAILVLVHIALIVFIGVEFEAFGRYYRL